MEKLLYKGFVVCLATVVMGCITTGSNGVEEIDIYENTSVYIPADQPESPKFSGLPQTYEQAALSFYDRPFNELYY